MGFAIVASFVAGHLHSCEFGRGYAEGLFYLAGVVAGSGDSYGCCPNVDITAVCDFVVLLFCQAFDGQLRCYGFSGIDVAAFQTCHFFLTDVCRVYHNVNFAGVCVVVRSADFVVHSCRSGVCPARCFCCVLAVFLGSVGYLGILWQSFYCDSMGLAVVVPFVTCYLHSGKLSWGYAEGLLYLAGVVTFAGDRHGCSTYVEIATV